MAEFKHISIDGTTYDAPIQVQSDWSQTDNTAIDYIKNKPSIPSGQVQSDWTQTDVNAVDYIKNKPSLASVATSGSYDDLSNTPTIPAAQIQSDWSQTNSSALDYIKNKPSLAAVATSGSYNDLSNKPSIDSTLSTTSSNAVINSAIATAINNNKNFTKINTNNSLLSLYRNGDQRVIINTYWSIITITNTGSQVIDKITNSSDRPTRSVSVPAVLFGGGGAYVYPCVVLIDPNGDITLLQKDASSGQLYLAVSAYLYLYFS